MCLFLFLFFQFSLFFSFFSKSTKKLWNAQSISRRRLFHFKAKELVNQNQIPTPRFPSSRCAVVLAYLFSFFLREKIAESSLLSSSCMGEKGKKTHLFRSLRIYKCYTITTCFWKHSLNTIERAKRCRERQTIIKASKKGIREGRVCLLKSWKETRWARKNRRNVLKDLQERSLQVLISFANYPISISQNNQNNWSRICRSKISTWLMSRISFLRFRV